MKVKVEEVTFSKGRNPIAVNVQKGDFITDEFLSNVKVDVFTDTSNKTVVAAHTDKMLYVGKINYEESDFNNFLVVRNKKTNKVRLINFDSVEMEPVKRLGKSASKQPTVCVNGTRSDLTKAFGSQQAKRAVERREKLKFDVENAKASIESALTVSKTDESLLNNSQSQTEEGDYSYLPTINRDATRVEQVYELENLIPSEVLDGLELDVKTILETDDISELPLGKFCMQNIRLLKGNDEIESNSTRCKIYLYLNYLVQFFTTPVRSMNRKYVLCYSSADVNSYILDNFSISVKNTRTRSLFMKDKLICYILVLAALASGTYTVDLEVLSQDMKMGMKKLMEISRLVGFASSGTKKIIIKLPLPAAPSRKRRR